MIEVINVKKRYSTENMIVKGVSFTVKPGIIYGLLGPNGAGKTTLMQMIATLMKPTSGTIEVDGLTPENDISDEKPRQRRDHRGPRRNNHHN